MTYTTKQIAYLDKLAMATECYKQATAEVIRLGDELDRAKLKAAKQSKPRPTEEDVLEADNAEIAAIFEELVQAEEWQTTERGWIAKNKAKLAELGVITTVA